jgi:hypothetical protein
MARAASSPVRVEVKERLMNDQNQRIKAAVLSMRMLAALALFVTAWSGASTPVTAQEDGERPVNLGITATTACDGTSSCGLPVGARFIVTTEVGEVMGTCTLEGSGNETYIVACYVPVPFGITMIVTEDISTIIPGCAPVENPLYIDTSTIDGTASFEGVGFHNVCQGGNASSGEMSDVAIATMENGQSATGACYVLLDYSNEGCDENGDGQVTFDDIPFGTYTVQQTRTPAGYPTINDYTINVEPFQGMPGEDLLVCLWDSSSSRLRNRTPRIPATSRWS